MEFTVEKVKNDVKKLASTNHFNKMSRFGIETDRAWGVKIPDLRNYAKLLKKNHSLALQLWQTEIHELQILASYIADPEKFDEVDIDKWVYSFDSWDICDQTCAIFAKTKYVDSLIHKYVKNELEFVKRTAFVLICYLAVKNKDLIDNVFNQYLYLIENESFDERNFVKKAVNWALRQIGKRNAVLRIQAIETAEKIRLQDSKSAKWIASDALRELNDEKIVRRINAKKQP